MAIGHREYRKANVDYISSVFLCSMHLKFFLHLKESKD